MQSCLSGPLVEQWPVAISTNKLSTSESTQGYSTLLFPQLEGGELFSKEASFYRQTEHLQIPEGGHTKLLITPVFAD